MKTSIDSRPLLIIQSPEVGGTIHSGQIGESTLNNNSPQHILHIIEI